MKFESCDRCEFETDFGGAGDGRPKDLDVKDTPRLRIMAGCVGDGDKCE